MYPFDPNRCYKTTDPELAVIATRGTLSQWRHQGKGPPYIKLGNRVLYKGSDLNEWLDARVVRPTNP
ncbi:MAG: helix-turn-helix domain-containing protein [Gemmatimonadota bacterium]|nr:helix-turn-helix domain-containing protein [Gemmatimonadota bacterium]